jgi:hypothetical protein
MKDSNLIFSLNWFGIKLKRFLMQLNKKNSLRNVEFDLGIWDQTEVQTSSVERTFSSQIFFCKQLNFNLE